MLAKLSESRVRWCGHPRPERTGTERMERVSRVTHVRYPPPRSPLARSLFRSRVPPEKRETSSNGSCVTVHRYACHLVLSLALSVSKTSSNENCAHVKTEMRPLVVENRVGNSGVDREFTSFLENRGSTFLRHRFNVPHS